MRRRTRRLPRDRPTPPFRERLANLVWRAEEFSARHITQRRLHRQLDRLRVLGQRGDAPTRSQPES
ncbi:hypothetical protein YW7DRAFT_02863 [Streptomyces sp. AmelKG-E11A]|nr:hypothetical protein YW7DRAFT_02863 [Streptomyces sp. AmelKG-E11A]